MLREKYPEYFKQRVFFHAVLHNKNSVEAIFTYFKNKFDVKPSILQLNTIGIRKDKADEFRKTYVDENESLFDSRDYSLIEQEMFIKLPTIQSVSSLLFHSIDFYYNNYNDFFHPLRLRVTHPTDTCMPFSKKVYLTVNGKILPCERIGQHLELGWVRPEGVQLDLQEIADRYNRWFEQMRNQCQSCYIYNQCSQCLFFLEPKDGKRVCARIQNLEKYSRYLSSFLSFFEKRPGLFDRILKEVLFE
jgi:uncharacterized protein